MERRPGFPTVPPEMDAIGGYFGFAKIAPLTRTFHPNGVAFQSGRAAFVALLHAAKPRCVWMPWYLCDSMSQAAGQAGVRVRRYPLAADFSMAADIPFDSADLLVYVNHFGLLDDVLDSFLRLYPAPRIVVDNSQAFYAAARPVLGNIYSPRKFLPVPDGGYLIARGINVASYPQDISSQMRSLHLRKRAEAGAEAGYADFMAAEQSLSGQPPLEMSSFTRGLLDRLEHKEIQERRRRNFIFIKERLDEFNELKWTLRDGAVPLCYPFLQNRVSLRQILRESRIYTACYWPELLEAARAVPEIERRWARQLVALPIDQRYEPEVLEEHLVLPLLSILRS